MLIRHLPLGDYVNPVTESGHNFGNRYRYYFFLLTRIRIPTILAIDLGAAFEQIKGNPVKLRNGPAAVTGDERQLCHC